MSSDDDNDSYTLTDQELGIRKLSIRRVPSANELLYDLVNKNWPQTPINIRVQEIGSEFFEEFSRALQSYSNFKERCSEQVNLFKREYVPGDSEGIGFNPDDMKLEKEDYESLYMEALYTIKHRIGKTSQDHVGKVNELVRYVQKAFNFSDQEHSRLLRSSVEAKPPVVVLEVNVVEGRNLMAKDADGFSDPYCMLGIVPTSVGSKLLSHVSSIDKKKLNVTASDMIPAKYIKTTSVKFNTLQPVWNEKFRFDLEDVRTDKLHLDVWDRDDDFSVVDSAKKLNEVKGIKGLGRYFKQIAQSARANNDENVDDFMGTIEVLLSEIPSTGLNKWYDLTSRSTKSKVQGQVRLELHLATREDRWRDGEDDDDEELSEMREHKNLMRTFIEYEYNLAKENGEEWNGELSKEARTILHQHAIQGDISDVRKDICWWLAMVHQYCRKLFSVGYLLDSLNALESEWKNSSLYREDVEVLAQSFKQCVAFLLKVIDFRIELSGGIIVDLNAIRTTLMCLVKLYDSSVFQHCLPFQASLKAEIIGLIKDLYASSYKQFRSSKNISAGEQDLIKRYTHTIRNLIITLMVGKDVYNSLFLSTVNVDFFRIAYKKTYMLLSKDLPNDLNDLLSQSDENWDKIGYQDDDEDSCYNSCIPVFKLFLVIRKFFNLSRYLSESDRKELPPLNYNPSFKPYLNHWVDVVDNLLTRRLKFLHHLEKVENVSDEIVQSSLAVDVAYCFGQVVNFWLNLRWPDDDGTYAGRFVKIISEGSLEITEMMVQKLTRAGYYDEIGQFDISEELCITINNMEQVRKAYLAAASSFIIANSDWLTVEEKRKNESKNQLVRDVMTQTDELLVESIKNVSDKVADKMRPDIKKVIFHLCWAPEAASHHESIINLMNYLDGNLATVNKCLLKVNFQKILQSIWVEVLEEIDSIITTSVEEINEGKWIPKRLYQSLNVLLDFFHAGGKGLTKEMLKCELYQSVVGRLEAMMMTVFELINEFYKQKLLLQSQQDTVSNGYITIRAYYNVGSVVVEVMSARNLIPMDANGLSDPFVVVELGPRFMFGSKVHQGQTKVVKKSLNPDFNDSFTFEIPEELCRSQSASVVFTIMDHDLLSTNDFAGEAYFPLNQLPGLTATTPKSKLKFPMETSSPPPSSSSSASSKQGYDNDHHHHHHLHHQTKSLSSALMPITLGIMHGTETKCDRLVTILEALKMRKKDDPIVQDFLQRKANTVPKPD